MLHLLLQDDLNRVVLVLLPELDKAVQQVATKFELHRVTSVGDDVRRQSLQSVVASVGGCVVAVAQLVHLFDEQMEPIEPKRSA